MGCNLPSFFLMKKNDTVYGLLDGRMVPLIKCSFMNFLSSPSSGCDNGISFPGRDAGAPGLSSIAWSQMHDGGNSCDASSLNTLEYWWYCSGILSCLERSVCSVGLITILPMKYQSCWQFLGWLICHGMNHAFIVLGAQSMIGNWEWSIHPLFQSICGCAAANQGYPKM